MAPDNELLARWLKSGSEQDFAELVTRHLALVHSAALRVVNGDRHLADDVTQTVFTDLARKARSLRDRSSLAGWLHQSARLTAMSHVSGEARRRQREQEAFSMPTDSSSDTPDWCDLQPVVDAAVGDLSTKDREALLLRYFENRSHREIGQILGLNDNAARMRVERALDKARRLLAKRGVTSSASGLAAVLLAHATLGTTSVTAAQITATALTSATAVGSGFTLFHLMTATQLKTGIAVATVVAGLTVPIVVQHGTIADLKTENASMASKLPQIAALEAENARLHGDTVDRAELDTLRLEHAELLRLRHENDQLKESARQLAQNVEQVTKRLDTKVQEEKERQAEEAQQKSSVAKMNCVKWLSLAAIIHAQNNGGAMPGTMGEIERTLQSDSNLGEASTTLKDLAAEQGVQPDQFEVLQIGSMEDLQNPGSAILLRERQPWQTTKGQWAKSYAFADGHSEVVVRDRPEDFQSFDAEHAPVHGARSGGL